MNVKFTINGQVDPKNLDKIMAQVTKILEFYLSYTESWEIKKEMDQ